MSRQHRRFAMARDLALTIDVGTGSSRAAVFSIGQNRTLASAVRDNSVFHPTPQHAEFDATRWRQCIVEAAAEAVGKARRPGAEYLGITATSLRQGFVLLDSDGVPLAPGVLNYDRRGAAYCSAIEARVGIETLYQVTGHWPAPELTLPKLLWFRHERPDVWRRARSFLFVHDWILFALCGEKGTSPSMICAGQMADVQSRTWAEDLLRDLGLHTDLLPRVCEAGVRLGGLTASAGQSIGLPTGTPVFVGGGDTQVGCLGAGAMEPGMTVIVGGSTTPVMMTAARPLFDRLRYPWVSAHLHPAMWAVETNAGHTGMIYRWFRDCFGQALSAEASRLDRGSYAILDELAAQAPIGSDGLLVVATSPRWAQDTWERKAPYVIHNFSVSHTLGHVARAILESVCYGVRGNLEQLERVAGKLSQKLLFTGGSAGAPLWAQMMADVLGRPLYVPQISEPAASAGAQLVLWGQGSSAVLPGPPTLAYEPDLERTGQYEPHFRTYLDVFEKMQRHFASRADGGDP